MSVSKLMKSSSLFVVNQHGSCHLSIIIKLAGRSRPGGRSEYSGSWPYNKDSFVCIDSAVEECYNLSHTELHCLQARERTRERRDIDGQRDGQTGIWTYGRTSLALKNSLVLNCETIQYLTGRGSVGGGLIDRRLSSEYDRCPVKQADTKLQLSDLWPIYIPFSLQLFSVMWIKLRRPIKRRLISVAI